MQSCQSEDAELVAGVEHRLVGVDGGARDADHVEVGLAGQLECAGGPRAASVRKLTGSGGNQLAPRTKIGTPLTTKVKPPSDAVDLDRAEADPPEWVAASPMRRLTS